MKKSLIIFSLCFLLLIGFVSAFSFSDFWNKFTGKVVDYSDQPYCTAIGTRSESWRNSGGFIKYDICEGCEAVCKLATSKRVEGWYSSCDESLILEEDCDCADTCLSLGYECGPQVVCGENISCGRCRLDEICVEGICERICSDGTFVNKCSVTKPKYCDNGNLIDNCLECGCPLGQTCFRNGHCQINPLEGKLQVVLGEDYNLWEDHPEWYLQGTVENLDLSEKEGKILEIQTDTNDNYLEFELYKGFIDPNSPGMWYNQEGIFLERGSGKQINPHLKFEIPSGGEYSLLYLSRPNEDNVPEDLIIERTLSFNNDWNELNDCSSSVSGVLKALAVIVDFQDRKLEDYEEEGINSVSDFRNILDKMEAHWEWMSAGKELQSWDIIRITLPKDFTTDAYLDANIFRNEVVRLVQEQVNDVDYDNDCDGQIDNIFAIVSSEDYDGSNSDYDYLSFGSAYKNRGVRIFMDSQGSRSVRDEIYGNFNHELGHGHIVRNGFWGLPDIYGNYDTLGYLSLMSDSWPLPAVGFSAYDRYLLQWTNPEGIFSTEKDIFLSPAEKSLDVIKILTDNPKEFFLIEYKRKPEEGFGSASSIPDYNGLVIYHVYEEVFWGYCNDGFPPLLYVEPADGDILYASGGPEKTDYWYPENEKSTGIFSAKKWNSDEIIFTIENLRWSGEGMIFDVNFDDDMEEPLEKIESKNKSAQKKLFCENGCFLDDSCYPISYRKSGQFCSENGYFTDQFKEGKSCENNFECESNVCAGGRCISGSLIQRIMNWFRKFFGRE